MRRLAALAAIILLAAGCNWSSGLHWRRIAGTPTADGHGQTVVYFENHVADYQGPYVAWAARQFSRSSRLEIRLVARCPTRTPRNCVPWYTRDISYAGLTSIGVSGRHILSGSGTWVKLDPTVGRVGSISQNRRVAYEEACHALGGGFGGHAVHAMCRPAEHAHNLAEIVRVYAHRH